MKIKRIIVIVFTVLFMFMLLISPDSSVKGAVKGLVMCSNIVIPSLFPFGVCVLFLYNTGLFSIIESKITAFSRFLFGINGSCFCIFIMSLLGGYPIGAILIENQYSKNQISKRNAENLLSYCVNSGPAFIIIGIGNGIFFNLKAGLLLFIANFLASIFLALILKKYSVYEEFSQKASFERNLTDTFVESTAEVSKSIISVCSFVVLFSAVIGMISSLPMSYSIKKAVSIFLEITNGSVIAGQNMYLLSFLLGFSGFCVHFQILSVLRTLKPSYIKFFLGRVLHGVLCLIFSYILFKIFPVKIETLSLNAFSGKLSSVSLPFSAALFFLCATFLLSIKNGGRKI